MKAGSLLFSAQHWQSVLPPCIWGFFTDQVQTSDERNHTHASHIQVFDHRFLLTPRSNVGLRAFLRQQRINQQDRR